MTKRHINIFILINIVLLLSNCKEDKSPRTIETLHTVNGSIASSELGLTLTHEHIMSNFGLNMSEASQYDSIRLFDQVIPYLKRLKKLGVNSILDCTTKYFGRRTDLLKTISDSTGIHIITNTGIYGAANDRYVPAFALQSNAKKISQIWIDEFENGIDGSDVKPGFVKLAFDDGKPSEIDKKLFEAGILTHLSTGLTLAVHTGNNLDAVNFQIGLLKKYSVHPSAWVWVHANKFPDDDVLIDLASKGAWISHDGVNQSNYLEFLERIKLFKRKKLLNKVLLSHDGNAFPGGGDMRELEAILVNLIPAMIANGFSKVEVNQIMIQNPIDAFQIKIRQL